MTSVRRSRTNVTRWFLSHIRGGDSSSRQVLEEYTSHHRRTDLSPHRVAASATSTSHASDPAKRPHRGPRSSKGGGRALRVGGVGESGGRRRRRCHERQAAALRNGTPRPHTQRRLRRGVLPQCSLQARTGSPQRGYREALTLGWLGTTGDFVEPPPCGPA